MPGGRPQQLGRDGLGLGADVHAEGDVDRGETARLDAHAHARPLGRAARAQGERLVGGEAEPGRASRPQGHERAQVLDEQVGPRPGSARHVRPRDADARGGQAQPLREEAAHAERGPGRGPHDEPLVLVEPRHRDRRLQRHERSERQPPLPFDDDAGRGEGRVHVALRHGDPGGDRRVVLVLDAEDGRPRLERDRHGVGRPPRELRVLRGRRGERRAEEGRLLAQKSRRVGRREHQRDARQRRRRGRVGRNDAGAGERRAAHGDVQETGQRDVVGERDLPGGAPQAHVALRAAASTAATGRP